MLFVVEKKIDGEIKYQVVEASDPNDAMHADSCIRITKDGELEQPEGTNVEIIGIYEVGQVNHLISLSHKFEIHRYYREVIEKLGFNPNTYERL